MNYVTQKNNEERLFDLSQCPHVCLIDLFNHLKLICSYGYNSNRLLNLI